MRARVGFGAFFGGLAVVGAAACGFGVDLDGLFGEAPGDGGTVEGSVDGGGGEAGAEAGIPSLEVQQLSMGSTFGCGRRIDGTIMCWGQDTGIGELGDGLISSSSTPVLVKDIADATDLALGQHHGCVVRAAGTVACWGENQQRQLGDGTTGRSATPKAVLQLVDAQKLALGNAFSCALRKDATVYCWGENVSSQLGDGSVTSRSQPAPVTGLAAVTQVVAGEATACALVKGGDVLCWGRNNLGQTGSPAPTDVKLPLKVAGLSGVAAIGASADANHFCAVLATGGVRCWGAGTNGNLGNATTANSAVPVAALAISDAVGVTTGLGHSCAWRKGGAVSCWGLNDWRQVGLGDATLSDDVSSPLPIEGVTNVKQVSAGESHTCALLTDGKHVSCWGTNLGGALGRGTRVRSDVPAKVTTTTPIAAFALGAEHSCGLSTKGELSCWGYNNFRQLGVVTFLATGTPTPVPMVSGVSRAVAGEYHTCALSSGKPRCWGGGQYGNFGSGSAPYIEPVPQAFAASGVADVGAGYWFTCAILGSQDVACAGLNDSTRLGFSGGNTATPGLVLNNVPYDAGGIDGGPEAGPPPVGATRLSIGRVHSCLLRGGGNLSCWGSNDFGQCGVSASGSTLLADVALPGPVIDVANGGAHTCVVMQDGTVRCWGINNHGQTTGATADGPSQRVPDLKGKKATAIAAGEDHTCAILDDQSLVCWGKGVSGQLGNAVRSDQASPVAVKNLAGVKAISARANRTCAALMDGSAYCWGDNHAGELGDGAVMTTGVPGSIVGY